ncbi:hypothetical protein GDO86_007070 [Hymenochirus boettgeri]|uniref:TTF-type domain-containing protein n=1 Tax=Hymenochirus boettgeri TaxID=247094 RepID=A0A8T2JG37_9PIPI|nr:hypothetical protein GDO86_007070 [Hymenochirus boettgeri]
MAVRTGSGSSSVLGRMYTLDGVTVCSTGGCSNLDSLDKKKKMSEGGQKRKKLSGAAYKKLRLAKAAAAAAALLNQKETILPFVKSQVPMEKAGCSHDFNNEPALTVKSEESMDDAGHSPHFESDPAVTVKSEVSMEDPGNIPHFESEPALTVKSEESMEDARHSPHFESEPALTIKSEESMEDAGDHFESEPSLTESFTTGNPVDENSSARMASTSSLSQIEVEIENSESFSVKLEEESAQDISVEEINESRSTGVRFSRLLLRDPGLWMDMDNDLRHFLVSNGPQQVTRFHFPRGKQKRGFDRKYYRRELPNSEIAERPWLMYSESKDSVFCFCCKIFPPKAAVSALCSTGFNDWKNINRNLSNHEKADYHIRAFCKWKDLETKLSLPSANADTSKEPIESETQHWRKVLKRLIIIVRTLATQNIVFRGKSNKIFEKNNGSFLKFIEQIREKIFAQLQAAKYYTLLLDCTQDLNHTEQITLMVRFVTANEEPESGSEMVSIKEHFLSIINVEDSTEAGMLKVLLENMEAFRMDLQDMRGQGYANESDMKIKDVHAHIQGLNPRACYMPCNLQSLNLSVTYAACCAIEAAELFLTIEKLYVFFSASTHRWNILRHHLSTSHQWLTLNPSSTTCWESHIDAVKAVRNQLGKIDDALFAVMEDPTLTGVPKSTTIVEARIIQDRICSFKFLCGLVVWCDILFEVNIMCKRFREIETDLDGAVEQMEKTRQYLQNYRSDEKFEEVIKTAQNLAKELDIDGNFPSEEDDSAGWNRRHFDCESRDEQITDPQQRFKVDFFYRVLDNVWESLQDRFEQIEEHSRLFGLLYTIPKVMELPSEEVRQQCDQLEKVLSHDRDHDIIAAELCYELYALCRYLPANCKTPRAVLEHIYKTKMSTIFSNVSVALRILLTLPVIACGENSFSKLKQIKTQLQCTMTHERLVGLATISYEHELAKSLNVDDLIQVFASQKARRTPL